MRTWPVSFLFLFVIGCNGTDPGPECSGQEGLRALVVTSDFQTGSYSLIDTSDLSVLPSINDIHSDAVCRVDKLTCRTYIVSRLNADSIQVLSPDCCEITREYSVGAGTNPQDLAVFSQGRAYIPRLQDRHLLVVHPTEGTELDAIDLSAHADPDGVPEAAWALVRDSKVYVVLQRLENFEPTDYSSILVLDGATGAVEDEVRLGATSPFAKLRYTEAMDHIVIGETGRFGELDGGVELLNTLNNELSGFYVTEETLGGDIADVLIASPRKGYAVVGYTQADFTMTTSVVAFDPLLGTRLGDLITSEGYDHFFFELTPDGSQLWITDRNMTSPGVRIFSTADDQEITETPLDVGLPPFMICFTGAS
jgi:hypothetical protein